MNEIIRYATIDDLQAVQSLNLKLFEKEQKEYDASYNLNRTFGEEGTTYYTNRILNDDGCVIVTLIDDTIVGYLCGGITKAESYRILPTVAELENTLVLEDFRSKGLGKKMFEEFLGRCKNKKVGKIRVAACAANEKAIKFYRTNNFHDYTLMLERDI